MEFDWTINIGTLITVIVFVTGAISAFYTLKYQSRDADNKSVANGEKIDSLKDSMDRNYQQTNNRINDVEQKVVHVELTLARHYVSADKLKETKEDLEKRLDRMEKNLIAVFSQPSTRRRSKPPSDE